MRFKIELITEGGDDQAIQDALAIYTDRRVVQSVRTQHEVFNFPEGCHVLLTEMRTEPWGERNMRVRKYIFEGFTRS